MGVWVWTTVMGGAPHSKWHLLVKGDPLGAAVALGVAVPGALWCGLTSYKEGKEDNKGCFIKPLGYLELSGTLGLMWNSPQSYPSSGRLHLQTAAAIG